MFPGPFPSHLLMGDDKNEVQGSKQKPRFENSRTALNLLPSLDFTWERFRRLSRLKHSTPRYTGQQHSLYHILTIM